jgi:hypothetical protein
MMPQRDKFSTKLNEIHAGKRSEENQRAAAIGLNAQKNDALSFKPGPRFTAPKETTAAAPAG